MASREQWVQQIATMDRDALMRLLDQMDCGFKLDFTEEFLRQMSVERLRHVVLAASLHNHNAVSQPGSPGA